MWGFKQGPLRLVQYALVRDKIKAIRNHPGRIERILNTSRNTVGALHDFSIRGDLNLSAETASELGDHYKFFLWQYHNSQQRYEREGQTVSTFDPADAKKRSDSLVKICSSQLIV